MLSARAPEAHVPTSNVATSSSTVIGAAAPAAEEPIMLEIFMKSQTSWNLMITVEGDRVKKVVIFLGSDGEPLNYGMLYSCPSSLVYILFDYQCSHRQPMHERGEPGASYRLNQLEFETSANTDRLQNVPRIDKEKNERSRHVTTCNDISSEITAMETLGFWPK